MREVDGKRKRLFDGTRWNMVIERRIVDNV